MVRNTMIADLNNSPARMSTDTSSVNCLTHFRLYGIAEILVRDHGTRRGEEVPKPGLRFAGDGERTELFRPSPTY